MRVVRSDAELAQSISMTKAEAKAAFSRVIRRIWRNTWRILVTSRSRYRLTVR
ncbi:hypothetical protein ACNKHR_16050 [Shigella flexneri]